MEGLPGYSLEGKETGQAAVIATGSPPLDSVIDWMSTFYHRIPMLHRDLTKVGFGFVKGGPDSWITVLDVKRGRGEPAVSVFPVPNQTNVSVKYYQKPNGFPITVTFPIGQELARPQIQIVDDRERKIRATLYEPEDTDGMSGKPLSVCLIPQRPLKPGTTYTVKASAWIARKRWQKSWSFTTEE